MWALLIKVDTDNTHTHKTRTTPPQHTPTTHTHNTITRQERKLEVIKTAESATLTSLCRAAQEAGAPCLRVHQGLRTTLAGDDEQLALQPGSEGAGGDEWWACSL